MVLIDRPLIMAVILLESWTEVTHVAGKQLQLMVPVNHCTESVLRLGGVYQLSRSVTTLCLMCFWVRVSDYLNFSTTLDSLKLRRQRELLVAVYSMLTYHISMCFPLGKSLLRCVLCVWWSHRPVRVPHPITLTFSLWSVACMKAEHQSKMLWGLSVLKIHPFQLGIKSIYNWFWSFCSPCTMSPLSDTPPGTKCRGRAIVNKVLFLLEKT